MNMTMKPDSCKPVSGNDLPSFTGIVIFMRLPQPASADADDVDIGLIGVPWDGSTTNRAGGCHHDV
jgi:guanidinopropionase